jgi:putative ABC transport system permease protein
MTTLHLSVRNLLRNPRRSALTIAGIALATATYILLISLGQSLVREIQGTVNLLGSELTVQQAGVGFPEMSWVTRDQIHELQTVPHVTGSLTVALTTTRLRGSAHFFVFGVGPGRPKIPGMEVVSGRLLEPGTNEVMFGYRAAETIGLSVGDVFTLRRRQLTVVGIYDTGRALLDRGAIFPVRLVQEMFRLGDRVNMVFLTLDGVEERDRVRAMIERRFPELEASPTDSWTSHYRQVDVIGQFVERLGVVALLIAALGIWSILTINVTERTLEMGVMRAIGWRRWKLVAVVLGEGTVLALVGAIIGIPLAKSIVLALPLLEALGLVSDTIPLAACGKGVAFTVLAGALGSAPALARVLRLEPAAALRAH